MFLITSAGCHVMCSSYTAAELFAVIITVPWSAELISWAVVRYKINGIPVSFTFIKKAENILIYKSFTK